MNTSEQAPESLLSGSGLPSVLDLPEDIMSMIIVDFLYEPGEDHHISITHTCQALRNLSLCHPQLWSHLSSQMPRHQVLTFLGRSRDVNLTIRLLKYERGGRKWWDFLRIIKPFSRRWRSLDFDPNGEHMGRRFFTRLSLELRDIELPHLNSLNVVIPRSYRWPQTEKDRRHDLPNFFSSWILPRLRILTISDIIPTHQNLFESITVLQLVMQDMVHRRWTVMEVYTLLSQMTRLRLLQLHFWDLCGDPESNGTAFPLLQFNSMSFLSVIAAKTRNQKGQDIHRLLQCMRMPNLQTYICTALPQRFVQGSRADMSMFRHIFPRSDTFGYLRQLFVFTLGESSEPFPIEWILGNLPCLDSITIFSKHMAQSFELSSGAACIPPRLRVMRFMRCNGLKLKFLRDLADALWGSPWRELHFEKLEFSGCEGIPREDLESLLPEGKVVLTDCMFAVDQLIGYVHSGFFTVYLVG